MRGALVKEVTVTPTRGLIQHTHDLVAQVLDSRHLPGETSAVLPINEVRRQIRDRWEVWGQWAVEWNLNQSIRHTGYSRALGVACSIEKVVRGSHRHRGLSRCDDRRRQSSRLKRKVEEVEGRLHHEEGYRRSFEHVRDIDARQFLLVRRVGAEPLDAAGLLQRLHGAPDVLDCVLDERGTGDVVHDCASHANLPIRRLRAQQELHGITREFGDRCREEAGDGSDAELNHPREQRFDPLSMVPCSDASSRATAQQRNLRPLEAVLLAVRSRSIKQLTQYGLEVGPSSEINEVVGASGGRRRVVRCADTALSGRPDARGEGGAIDREQVWRRASVYQQFARSLAQEDGGAALRDEDFVVLAKMRIHLAIVAEQSRLG
mmetsp:Transcript_37721/g.72605  ORF Transcript_37721/g.72605 Transcript_37721/m.72605 type:complete len:376 (-) Transcript_37721:898-2025(-)